MAAKDDFEILKDAVKNGLQSVTLPDGRRVPVSQLPSLGYVFHEGQWKHQSELTTADMPANVDPNSPQWLSILNTSLQSGSQLYSMSSELASALSRSIKSTNVNWINKVVEVTVKFGFQVYKGVITPTSNITKTYSDQEIKITSAGQQVKIKLLIIFVPDVPIGLRASVLTRVVCFCEC